jgi:hypothetical protein
MTHTSSQPAGTKYDYNLDDFSFQQTTSPPNLQFTTNTSYPLGHYPHPPQMMPQPMVSTPQPRSCCENHELRADNVKLPPSRSDNLSLMYNSGTRFAPFSEGRHQTQTRTSRPPNLAARTVPSTRISPQALGGDYPWGHDGAMDPGAAAEINNRLNWPDTMATQQPVATGNHNNGEPWSTQPRRIAALQQSSPSSSASLSPESYISYAPKYESLSPEDITGYSQQNNIWQLANSSSPEDMKLSPASAVASNAQMYRTYNQQPGQAILGSNDSVPVNINTPQYVQPIQQHRRPMGPPSSNVAHLGFGNAKPGVNTSARLQPSYSTTHSPTPGYNGTPAYISQQQSAPRSVGPRLSDYPLLAQRSIARGNENDRDSTPRTDPPSARSANGPTRRHKDDEVLLEGKKQGLTYKAIREQLGNTVAESTLRGRYRALTKVKDKRVRKPVWKEKDVSISNLCCGPHTNQHRSAF